jgi:PAS domain S-box-containing protein
MDTSTTLRRTFALLALVLACCLAVEFAINQANLASSSRADRRLKTLSDLGSVLVALTNIETAQRGYLLTGDVAYLDSGTDDINSRLDAVDRDVPTTGVDPKDAALLRTLAGERVTEMHKTVDLYSHGKQPEALAIVKTNEGLALKSKTESLLHQMLGAEAALLTKDRQQADFDTKTQSVVFGLAILFSFASLIFAFRRIQEASVARETISDEFLAQKQLLEVTLGSIGDGVIVTDTEARITFINDVAVTLTGWPREDAIGQPCSSVFNIINEVTREPVESPVDTVIELGTISGLANHTLLVRRDGSEIPIDDSGAPIRDWDGTLRGVVLVFRDFAEYNDAQLQLHAAVEDATSAAVSKDNFLARLSHELRTPLTPLKATLSAWATDPKLPLPYQDDVQIMLRSVALEARLIDDLLDIGRITRGQLRTEPTMIDVNHLVQEIVDLFATEIRDHGLTIETRFAADQTIVIVDPARLQQVFWNILRNAIKFTRSGGNIIVSTSNLVSGKVSISFVDTGIGMSRETLKRVFTPFEHGPDEIARQYGGLGLGMAISQSLVETHGGTIDAASDGEGKGSKFVVTLTATGGTAPPYPALSNDNTESTGRTLKVLLVEDHADSAYVLGRLLDRGGHNVRTVGTVEAAKQAFAEEVPDMLISDLGLPDASGLDLIRYVRATYGDRFAAIALSGYGMEADIRKSMDAGFQAHVTKPVSFFKLEAAIQKIIAGEWAQPI